MPRSVRCFINVHYHNYFRTQIQPVEQTSLSMHRGCTPSKRSNEPCVAVRKLIHPVVRSGHFRSHFQRSRSTPNPLILESTISCELFGVLSTPVLPQWHVKDHDHSAKSADGRLHLNTYTPLTPRSRSGLTMPLSRYGMGTYVETSSRATCQGTLGHIVSAR